MAVDAVQPPRLGARALAVAGVSGITLLLTLGWQMLIASSLGASPALDAFWVALAIPRAVAESFHLGLLTLLFVVIFRQQDDPRSTPWRSAAAVLNVTLVATGVAVVLLVAFAAMLVRWTAPGLAPADQQLATTLLRQLAWMLVPTAIAGALGGAAISRGALLPFTLSRAVMPAVQILVLLLVGTAAGAQALVWSLWLGVIAGLVVFLPAIRGGDVRYRLGFDWDNADTRSIVRLQAVLGVVWLLILLNQAIDRYIASWLGPGQVSALEFAWRFEIPIAQIVSLGVALPTFALLARSAAPDRRHEFLATLASSGRLLVTAVVPMLAFMIVLREPLASLWFERGAFSAGAAAQVASLLPSLAIVYFCRAFASILVFGLLMTNRWQLLLAGLTGEVLLHAGLAAVLAPRFGLTGITVAAATAMAIANLALWCALLRDIGAANPIRVAEGALPSLAATLVAAAALEFARRMVDRAGFAASGANEVVHLLLFGAGYLVLYVGAGACTGVIRFDMGWRRPRLASGPME